MGGRELQIMTRVGRLSRDFLLQRVRGRLLALLRLLFIHLQDDLHRRLGRDGFVIMATANGLVAARSLALCCASTSFGSACRMTSQSLMAWVKLPRFSSKRARARLMVASFGSFC